MFESLLYDYVVSDQLCKLPLPHFLYPLIGDNNGFYHVRFYTD